MISSKAFNFWEVGDQFYYLEYHESYMSGSIGAFIVKRDTILNFSGDDAINGVYGIRHYTDITPSEQNAMNVAFERNNLLRIASKISL